MKYFKSKTGLAVLWLASQFSRQTKTRRWLLGLAAFLTISATSCDGGPFVSCYDPVNPNTPVDSTQNQPDSSKHIILPVSPDSTIDQ